jgi:hypothetical protein
MPDRLLELYAALGHDDRLIEQCLVAPLLVSRMTSSLSDTGRAAEGAFDGRGRDTRGSLRITQAPGVGVRDDQEGAATPPTWASPREGCFPVDVWNDTSLAGAPTARVGHTAVWTGSLIDHHREKCSFP